MRLQSGRVWILFCGAYLLEAIVLSQMLLAQTAATLPASQPVASPTSAPVGEIESMLTSAQQLLKTKQYAEAVAAYRRVLAVEPNSVAAFMGLAISAAEQGQSADALNYFEQALNAAIDRGEYQVGDRIVQEALQLDPNSPIVLRCQAALYSATGRAAQAVDAYVKYMRTEAGRNDDRARLALGKLYLDQKYPRQALNMLQRAEQIDPRDPEVQAALARTYQAIRELSQAEKYIGWAIQGDSEKVEYYELQAQILLDVKKLPEAEASCGKGLEVAKAQLVKKPDNLKLLQTLERMYRTAIAVLEARRAADAKNAGLLLNLAQMNEDVQAVSQTIQLHVVLNLLLEASRLSPEDIKILDKLASVQFQVMKKADAAATCRRILSLDPGHAAALRLLDRTAVAESQPAVRP